MTLPTTDDSHTSQLVAAAIANFLDTTPSRVRSSRSLFDLPGFDSVCIATVLERLEDELRVEVPADRIVPEAFESLESLTRLLDTAISEEPTTRGNAEKEPRR